MVSNWLIVTDYDTKTAGRLEAPIKLVYLALILFVAVSLV
jgi:hypothetical protein